MPILDKVAEKLSWSTFDSLPELEEQSLGPGSTKKKSSREHSLLSVETLKDTS